MNEGYRPGNEQTARLVERWSGAPVNAFLGSNSVEYLRDIGQLSDLNFILEHIDDVDAVFALANGEITSLHARDHFHNRVG